MGPKIVQGLLEDIRLCSSLSSNVITIRIKKKMNHVVPRRRLLIQRWSSDRKGFLPPPPQSTQFFQVTMVDGITHWTAIFV